MNGPGRGALRIEHAEHISAADIPRFGRFGVIASMHPLFPPAVWPLQETCIGSHRMREAFPWRSIAHSGGRVVYGSDFPAYTLNPWEAIQVLVAGHPMIDQCVSVVEAIDGYTREAAHAGGREATEGTLEVGKVADLVIASQDVFTVPTADIGRTKADLTMVGGRVVYRSN
jgi:hypothetical protein